MSLHGIDAPKLRATSTVPCLPSSGSQYSSFQRADAPTASGPAARATAFCTFPCTRRSAYLMPTSRPMPAPTPAATPRSALPVAWATPAPTLADATAPRPELVADEPASVQPDIAIEIPSKAMAARRMDPSSGRNARTGPRVSVSTVGRLDRRGLVHGRPLLARLLGREELCVLGADHLADA